MSDGPKVTVLTPVYNGEPYIAKCIESVLHQSYTNWEYVIVNNCSTDSTLSTVRQYAQRDPRVRIVDNTSFVGVIENHNLAFAQVSPDSKYCKVVSADDWIYPECLERMVDVAERNPSVGVVSCYAISNVGALRQANTPLDREVFPGREVARMQLQGIHVLPPPTSLLYRAELVRSSQPFFPVARPSADYHALYRLLQSHDYGFVHQILSFERWHDASVTANLAGLNSFLVDRIEALVVYGEEYLGSQERHARLDVVLSDYYGFVADQAVHGAGAAFWRYHRGRLADLGYPLESRRIAGLIGLKVLDWLGNPKRSVEKIWSRLSSASPRRTRSVRQPP